MSKVFNGNNLRVPKQPLILPKKQDTMAQIKKGQLASKKPAQSQDTKARAKQAAFHSGDRPTARSGFSSNPKFPSQTEFVVRLPNNKEVSFRNNQVRGIETEVKEITRAFYSGEDNYKAVQELIHNSLSKTEGTFKEANWIGGPLSWPIISNLERYDKTRNPADFFKGFTTDDEKRAFLGVLPSVALYLGSHLFNPKETILYQAILLHAAKNAVTDKERALYKEFSDSKHILTNIEVFQNIEKRYFSPQAA